VVGRLHRFCCFAACTAFSSMRAGLGTRCLVACTSVSDAMFVCLAVCVVLASSLLSRLTSYATTLANNFKNHVVYELRQNVQHAELW
jgi:hypothetical protein